MLSYIGIGTCIGQPLNVPVLLRSLAVGMATIEEDKISLSFDTDFLISLDANPYDENLICQMVDNYECLWWKARKPRTLDLAEIFNKSSLEKCLDTHMDQVLGHTVTHSTPAAPSMTPATDTSCPRCTDYKNILSNTLLDLVNIHTYVDMMSTCSETQWNIDMRRASTFNLLHEAAVMKDVASDCSATNPIPIDKELIAQNAAEELERMKLLIPSSHKWTWGESLSESEVLSLRRPGKIHRNRVHSGYDMSLKPGKLTGQDSPFPSMPTSVDNPTTVEDAPAPPDNVADRYRNIRSLLFDPLGKTLPPQIFPFDALAGPPKDPNFSIERDNLRPRISAILTKDNIETFNAQMYSEEYVEQKDIAIEDAWKSDTQARTLTDGIEAVWSSASELVEGSLVKPIEVIWSSASDVDDKPVEDIWESEHSDDEVNHSPAPPVVNNSLALPVVHNSPATPRVHNSLAALLIHNSPAKPVEEEWHSASDDENSNSGPVISSSAPPNSQLFVSPSKITIEKSSQSFLFSSPWPENRLF